MNSHETAESDMSAVPRLIVYTMQPIAMHHSRRSQMIEPEEFRERPFG